ncbi:Fc.00g100890.m01.CDS01 [Cosmosporella sp. VM-42]
MDIASMLNEPTRPRSRDRMCEQLISPSTIHGGLTASSPMLPTPSPEYMPFRRESESSEGRARTPWDAGGYSLPILPGSKLSSTHGFSFRSPSERVDSLPSFTAFSAADDHSRHGSTDSSFGTSLSGVLTPLTHSRSDRFDSKIHHRKESSRSSFWLEHVFGIATGTSRNVAHKFSDSHSSLSSYGSSSFSGGHSRISSMSTISGVYSMGSAATDISMVDVNGEQPPQSHPVPNHRAMPRYDITSGPSEAVVGTKRKRSRLSEDQSQHFSYKKFASLWVSITISISIPLSLPEQGVGTRFQADSFSEPVSLPLRTEPTARDTHTRERVLQYARQFEFTLGTPLKGGTICQFVDNCNTDSVPRKVISHIFGRNKVCTRRIPERVWVCMCRKHYQRIRYRKGPLYSITQIKLVSEQIARMIFWSLGFEVNQEVNTEGISIQSWTFSIRKRELNRLTTELNEQSEIPRWIVENLGTGKTHDDIIDIVQRLRSDIEQGRLTDLPPVEFLPEVVEVGRATESPSQT